MYRRFLNNSDYLSIMTEEALTQIVRGSEQRFAQAEESAEMSVLEYLSENYEIEQELEKGKRIVGYNKQIIYPVGVHFYVDGAIYETIRTIGSQVRPCSEPYWEECVSLEAESEPERYSQMQTYYPGDIVQFGDSFYRCRKHNGIKFNDVRVPNVIGWEEVDTIGWEANIDYPVNQVVEFEGNFFAFCPDKDSQPDLTLSPMDEAAYKMIADYDDGYDSYELSPHEYVVYEGRVFVPVMNVNAPELEEGYNIRQGDPRNANLKKHILRLALYELHKLISPNNVSSVRVADYEASITWLRDAGRLKINPQIPRKTDCGKRPVADYAIATFMRDYNPYENMWHI